MRRARDAHAADAADVDEQSFQNEAFAPAPRRRGRGRGRHRAPAAQEFEQEPAVEPVAPEVDPTAFAAGMAGINQGLAALNQAMPLVQQMLQQRNQEMTDADASVLYPRVVEFRSMVQEMLWILLTPSKLGLGLDIMIIRG